MTHPNQLFLPIDYKPLSQGAWQTNAGWAAWVGPNNEGFVICHRVVLSLRWDDFGRSLTKSRTACKRWGVKTWGLWQGQHRSPAPRCPLLALFPPPQELSQTNPLSQPLSQELSQTLSH